MAVVVDLDKPLRSSVLIDGRSQHIEYEGLPSICYGCGRYGHSKDVCSYAKSGQGPVGGSIIYVVDGAPAVESRQAATKLYGPWMHVTGRRRRAAGNKRDSIDNRARGSFGTQASGSRFVALQDHGLNDDTGSEGDRMATRAGIMHDGVNMAGKAKEVNTNRSRQTRFAGGNSSMAFTKKSVNRSPITTNGPGKCSSEVGPVRAVGELHVVQAGVKKGNHTSVRISDPIENPVVLIEDPVIGSAGGNSIMQPSHRGLSVSKSSSKKGARIRRLADVRKFTLPILGEWVNSVTRELSNAVDPPGVLSSFDKENVHVHQDLIKASVHWLSDIPSKGNHHLGDGVCGLAFKRYFKLLVATHRPSVVAIFEPRVSGLQADRFMESRGGDLNVIQSMDERRGGAEGRCGISRQFCDFLFDSDLLDMGFVGPVFTWGRGGLFQRLDRCLCNHAWYEWALNSTVTHLPKLGSDHRPLLVSFDECLGTRGERPFRWLAAWQDHQDFQRFFRSRKSLLLARIHGIEKYLERNDSIFLSSLELELKAELDTVLREEELRAAVKWNVNNGCGVEFLNDIWVTNYGPLREEGIVSDAIDDSKVVDWVDVDGSWDWQRLCFVLPLNVVDQIAAIPPPRVSYGEDRPCWRLENNQKFSLRSAYASSYSVLGCDDRFDWLLIWKMKIPHRTRVFLWLALHGKLLTNLERKRRHLVKDDKCPFCSHEVESLDHVLRHCTFAVNVWNKVIPQRDLVVFNSMDLDDWFCSNLSQQVMVAWAKDGWSTKFVVVCLLLWNRINKRVFDGSFFEHETILQECDRWLKDLDLSGPVGRAMLQSHRFNACHQSGWARPALGWVKGNADGVVDLHSGSLGRCPVLMAELWAVHDMLKHAWNLGFRHVEIEIDNSEVHAIFSGKSMAFHGNSVVQVVHSLIALDWVVRFSLIRRDHNRVADALAKLSRGQPVSETLYAAPPASVHELLTADK
ncbi:hypothetical protein GQ457_14G001500 [Hibiscus cannabinus]